MFSVFIHFLFILKDQGLEVFNNAENNDNSIWIMQNYPKQSLGRYSFIWSMMPDRQDDTFIYHRSIVKPSKVFNTIKMYIFLNLLWIENDSLDFKLNKTTKNQFFNVKMWFRLTNGIVQKQSIFPGTSVTSVTASGRMELAASEHLFIRWRICIRWQVLPTHVSY